jgi:hypothetical protein
MIALFPKHINVTAGLAEHTPIRIIRPAFELTGDFGCLRIERLGDFSNSLISSTKREAGEIKIRKP